jgi:hypothetical protein
VHIDVHFHLHAFGIPASATVFEESVVPMTFLNYGLVGSLAAALLNNFRDLFARGNLAA